MPRALHRILLVGDNYGVPELLARIPKDRCAAIIASSVRPQYHAALQEIARAAGLKLLIQPRRSDAEACKDFLTELRSLRPDGLICHSYAMRIQPDLLDLVERRAFNVHAALLPRNRGPNPVQWALIHGDDATGVTLHVMDEAFDRGPIVDQEKVAIAPEDTWVTLHEKLKRSTIPLLDRALPNLLEGDWSAQAQDEAQACTNMRISPESFPIDFATMSDRSIFNLIRAQVAPLAGAYVEKAGQRIHFKDYVLLDDIERLRAQHD